MGEQESYGETCVMDFGHHASAAIKASSVCNFDRELERAGIYFYIRRQRQTYTYRQTETDT